MILETVSVGPMAANCYILAVKENSSAVIIDPGAQERKIRKALERHKLKPVLVLNTHGHYDHIGADDKFDVPVYVHEQDLSLLTDAQLNLSALFALPYRVESKIKTLRDGQLIKVEGIELKVLHIPGHTPGGIALQLLKPETGIVFSGDTLFCQGLGRSDLPGGSSELLIESIKEKLLKLNEETVVYPGHGPITTVGEEKRNNPFLRQR